MAAVELELITAMLQVGDLSPIHKGQFRAEHCLTNEGKALHHFLSGYRYITEGQGSVPTRNIVLQRFSHLDLPEQSDNPHPDFDALVHEVHVEATRSQLREYAVEIAQLAEIIDPMAEMHLARSRLDEIMTEISQDIDYGFDTHADIILEEYANGMILPHGLKWPWESLNEATRGMHKGEFIILSGRPKTRKTFIALVIAVHAFMCGARVLIFTPEMHPYMILLRSLAIAAHIRYSEFKKGELNPFEEMSLLETVKQVGKLDHDRFILAGEGLEEPTEDMDEGSLEDAQCEDNRPMAGSLFKVVKSTSRPVSFIHSKIQQYKPHFVMCDSFYRQSGEGAKKSDSDVKVLTSVSRALKDCASDEEIILLGTHQINRDGAKKVGDLTNLAYADAFGQDADLVLRAITNKREVGNDVTALAVLGGRETAIDGVLINNVPCSDFTEIAKITNLKKVMEMLEKEEEESEGDGTGGEAKKKDPWHGKKKKRSPAHAKKTKSRLELISEADENSIGRRTSIDTTSDDPNEVINEEEAESE